jgi:peptidoglycan/xylan/chitin deacetylase (PgdA/CDA1 family)
VTRQFLLRVAQALGLFAVCRWLTRGQQRILCYHGIWVGPPPHFGDCLFMSPPRFADRMAWLRRQGYGVISLDEACCRLRDGRVNERDLVITIDDAWQGIVHHMLPVLRQHAMPATLYVTTYYTLAQRPVLNVLLSYLVDRAPKPLALDDWVPDAEHMAPEALAGALATQVDQLPTLDDRWGEVRRIASALRLDLDALEVSGTFQLMSPEQLRQATTDGISIELHTHTHSLHSFEPDLVQREVEINRRHLAQILDRPTASFKHFCYPSGDYVPGIFETLRKAGVASATTTEFGLNRAGCEPLALRRILDCESLSTLEMEARLSGFWSIVGNLKPRVQRPPVQPPTGA